MTNRVIVMVSDLDDASHGEINVLEGPEQAARFVETLLESGFEQERVRVFGGDELGMQVHHRPVVNLVVDTPRGQKTEASRQQEQAPAPEAQPEQVEVAASAQTAAGATDSVASHAMAALEQAAQPFVRNGVRFSSQFRPA
ncbi:MAG: hypothetical protein ABI559_07345 [Chloroflexota bacterium]